MNLEIKEINEVLKEKQKADLTKKNVKYEIIIYKKSLS